MPKLLRKNKINSRGLIATTQNPATGLVGLPKLLSYAELSPLEEMFSEVGNAGCNSGEEIYDLSRGQLLDFCRGAIQTETALANLSGNDELLDTRKSGGIAEYHFDDIAVKQTLRFEFAPEIRDDVSGLTEVDLMKNISIIMEDASSNSGLWERLTIEELQNRGLVRLQYGNCRRHIQRTKSEYQRIILGMLDIFLLAQRNPPAAAKVLERYFRGLRRTTDK